MFGFRETVDIDLTPARGRRVDVAFTDATLDFGEGEGQAVAQARLVADGGVPERVARMHQVHGVDVVTVDGELTGDGDEQTEAPPVADALVTAARGAALMVRVADCVPVLLADPRAGVAGAVHAGRRGVELGVVTRTVDRMRSLGATEIRAWIGPHICGRCYEVPAPMRDEVAGRVPQTWGETSWGTPALDLGAGVIAQLTASGVDSLLVPGCTREDAALHSYRRDGAAAGRLAALVWLS